MSQINIIATFVPSAGKVERIRELLMNQCRAVHQKEDYALRFILTEETNNDTPSFSLFETYTSAEAFGDHLVESHFKVLMATLEEEALLETAPKILNTKTIAGFDLDRQWIA